MAAIIGVRFQKLGKIYHFDAGAYADTLHAGDYVLVTTSRGRQVGEVVETGAQPSPGEGDRRTIDRPASAQDLLLQQSLQEREEESLRFIRERAKAVGIRDARFHGVEYGFDGNHVTILYSTETDEKIDLKPLRSDVAHRFPHQQVEMRQIGPRDVARMICGFGSCGLDTRCCCQFLSEFNPISIKMAKAQGISLNPGEITGMCGRLRCCLYYEYEQYAEARQNLPKRGKRVQTPRGPGRVAEVFPLRDGLLIDLGEEQGMVEFRREEVSLLEEAPPGAAPREPREPAPLPETRPATDNRPDNRRGDRRGDRRGGRNGDRGPKPPAG